MSQVRGGKILLALSALGGEALRLVLDLLLPLLLATVYFLLLTPAAFLLRAGGRDRLGLKRDPGAATYWAPRTPPGRGDGMNQLY
jgi:hypothetical protein